MKTNSLPSVEKTTAPKSLADAYTKVLTERSAFYVKELGPDEKIPDYHNLGLQSLGDIENPEKIKHHITSYSLLKPLEELLIQADEAGKGWHKPPVTGVSLNELGQEFVALGVSGSVVSSILEQKDSLTLLEQHVKNSAPFNMKEVVLKDLEAPDRNIPADHKTLSGLFDYLFKKTASIALASVGAGEIASTLLTNAKKGSTGDLVFGDTKVEIKALGGRLGKAQYGFNNTAKGLASYLLSLKRTSGFGKESEQTLDYKDSIKKALLKIQGTPELAKSLDSKYFDLVRSFINQRDIFKLEKEIDRSQILQTTSREFMRRFVIDHDPNFPLRPITPPRSVEDSFVSSNNLIKDKLKAILALGDEHHAAEDVLDPKSLSMQDYPTSVQRFFLNDIGLTSEQAAEAFVKHAKTADIDNDRAMSVYGPAILKYFNSHYKSMKEGNTRALHAIIFAYSLALYAKLDGSQTHFDYFMMVNDSTSESISINTSGDAGSLITTAAELFLSNSKITLSVRGDERGGSAVFFGPRPKPKK